MYEAADSPSCRFWVSPVSRELCPVHCPERCALRFVHNQIGTNILTRFYEISLTLAYLARAMIGVQMKRYRLQMYGRKLFLAGNLYPKR